jgi:fatty-acyl-CoA synthase
MQRFAGLGKLPKYGVPDRYVVVDQIAKTSIGKINKKWLREQYKK